MFYKLDIDWPRTGVQQSVRPGAIVRGDAQRGIQVAATVLPGEYPADIVPLD
jgi:hypothetical protein